MKWLILFLLIFVVRAHARENVCTYFLNDSNHEENSISKTQYFISYLNYLFEERIIAEAELQNLIDGIKDQQKVINPVINKESQSAHRIHFENIEEHLKIKNLDQQDILNWCTTKLQNHKKLKIQKNETKDQTKNAFISMTFLPVEKGSLQMGRDRRIVQVTLTHDFEAMPTMVTQFMWAKTMGKKPSEHPRGPQRLKLEINEQVIDLLPDNPVENINWYSAAMYANRVSKEYGLHEVYNFEKVVFKPGTSAELGNLNIESGEVTINGANIYETEGYRLPTEAEAEFLLTDRGRAKFPYFTGVTKENFGDYAVYRENSDAQPKPVGSKLGYVIDGKTFYDLYGNVGMFTSDWYQDYVEGGTNPTGPTEGEGHVTRGCDYSSDLWAIENAGRGKWAPDLRSPWNGIRLVRTLK